MVKKTSCAMARIYLPTVRKGLDGGTCPTLLPAYCSLAVDSGLNQAFLCKIIGG